MEEKIRNGFDIEDLHSLVGIMIAGGEMELTDRDRIEKIKKWHVKGHKIFTDQQSIKKRERLTIDAKEISIGSEKMWIWVAVDLNDEMIIAIHVSYVKNRATTCSFLRKVAKLCKGTLPKVFVNGETWSPWAFEKLGFRYTPVDFGSGNVAETFLTIVNCRICKFLEKFTDKRTPKNILWWVEGFAGFTNYWTARQETAISGEQKYAK